MTAANSTDKTLPNPLARMGLPVQSEILPCSANYFHIPAQDVQSSLVFAVPIELQDDSGVAHVLEHLLLTGSKSPEEDSLFFRIRGESCAVDMNAVTNTKYLAVHYTCDDGQEFLRLLREFAAAIFDPTWQKDQLKREVGAPGNPGVIANEMAGVFSIPETYWALRAYAGLFAGGSSRFNPGGDPCNIVQVGANDVRAFWNRHFCVENLLVVSYGEMPPNLIRDELEHCLSRMKRGTKPRIPRSIPIAAPRLSRQLCKATSSQKVASAMLLPHSTSHSNALDIELLTSFFERFSDEISEGAARQGLKFHTPPRVRETDGDSFLFCVCTADSTEKIRGLWSLVAEECNRILANLSSESLAQLNQRAASLYFTLGNEKLGTGVAASLELLNLLCGSFSSVARIPYAGSIDELLGVSESREGWISLFRRAIRDNPVQVTIECDDDYAPVHQRFPGRSPGSERGEQEERHSVIEACRISENGSAVLPKRTTNWEVPEITHHQSLKIYHYRLPRPFLSSLKVSVAVPPGTGNILGEVFPEARIEARKRPGYSGYQVNLSFVSTGDFSTLASRYDEIDERLSVSEIVLSNEQTTGERKKITGDQIPPHQLAILRSASQLSKIAETRLAMAGVAVENDEEHTDQAPMEIDWEQFSKQPRSVFLATSDDQSGIPEFKAGEVVPEFDALMPDGSELLLPGKITESEEQPISGRLNFCARVWTLPPNFGSCAQKDVMPYLFATLLTNCYLEPVLRGERRAYAASADINIELGMLTMFSFRDPGFSTTDQLFKDSVEKILSGDFDDAAFIGARQRTLSRLKDKGSYDQRCEKHFDRLVQGYSPDYFENLRESLNTLSIEKYRELLANYFNGTCSAGYALVGTERTS